MNGEVPGSKYPLSAGKTDHTSVLGRPAGLVSVGSKVTPPHSVTARPRWSRYQARSASGSRALKKMPPMPTTRAVMGAPKRPVALAPLGRRELQGHLVYKRQETWN